MQHLTNVTFTLQQGATTVTGAVTNDGFTATFIPLTTLTFNTVYTATITTGAMDLSGNALAVNKVWSFTTGAAPDTTPPTVSSTIPADAATGVAINVKPTVTFSEAMDPSTITTAHFTLRHGTTPVSGTVTYAGLVATFTPAANLAANTVYTATITTGATDLAGNALASNFIWTFTTEVTPSTTAPTVIYTIPANGSTGVLINTNITARFSEPMNSATITTANFTVTGGGTSVTGTVALDHTGRNAVLTHPVNLAASTIYTGTITIGARNVAGTALASNFVWTFTTGTTTDATAPLLLITSPANGAANVPVNQIITAAFNKQMDPLTISAATFTLTGPS
jgi:hypothetical protein